MPAMTDEERDAFLAQPLICRLACLTDDGFPYVVPTWYAYANGAFYLVPRERSEWARYLQRDGRCSLCIDVSDSPYRRVIVRGRAEVLEEPNGGNRWVDFGARMAERYRGQAGLEYIERTKDEPRWLLVVRPEQMTTSTGEGWAKKYKHSDW